MFEYQRGKSKIGIPCVSQFVTFKTQNRTWNLQTSKNCQAVDSSACQHGDKHKHMKKSTKCLSIEILLGIEIAKTSAVHAGGICHKYADTGLDLV